MRYLKFTCTLKTLKQFKYLLELASHTSFVSPAVKLCGQCKIMLIFLKKITQIDRNYFKNGYELCHLNMGN